MESGKKSGPIKNAVRMFLESKITGVLVAGTFVFGAIAVIATPREENPRITVPTAIVSTAASGRTRDEVANLVTRPLERVIGQIADVDHVYSTSSDERSTITVRYRVGTDTTQAYVDLYTRLLGNRGVLPADVADPVVSRIDVDDVPVVVLTLASQTLDEVALRDVAYRLSDVLAPVAGIGAMTLYGGQTRSVNVTVDPRTLNAYALGFSDIDAALKGGAEQAAGYTADGRTRTDVRAGTAFGSARDVANATVAVRAGTPIALRDVATVTAGSPPRETYAWYSGAAGPQQANAVSIAIAKRSGTNVVTVADDVLATAQRFSLPSGVQLAVSRNDGEKADRAVNELFQRLVEAIVIVSLLLLITLGVREAAVVALAIPLTLFITLGVAMLAHETINRITLFALILSLGLLVDDAIVVIENIHRQMHASGDRASLIADAVAQVASPTILATLTVILAFLPMAFVSGLMGPYMRPIPLDVPVAMLASLVVAIVVTPWAALRVLRPRTARTRSLKNWEDRYQRWLAVLLQDASRRRVFLRSVVGAVGLAATLPLLQLVQFRMLPSQNEKTFSVTIDEPAGTDIERTRLAARAVERVVLDDPNTHDVESFVGTPAVPDFNSILRGTFARNAAWNAELRVNLVGPQQRSENSESIVRAMRAKVEAAGARFGAAVRLVEEPPGPPVRATVFGIVTAPNAAERERLAGRLFTLMRAEPGVVDTDMTVKVQPSRSHVVLDFRKASLSGVAPQIAARELAAAFGGVDSGVLRNPAARDAVPIVVRYGQADLTNADAFQRASIPGSAGVMVPLSSIATLQSETTPDTLYREDGQDVTYVTGEMSGRSSTYAVIDLLLATFRSHLIPAGSSVRWDGEWQLTLDVFRDLGIAMIIAIALIYLVLVARFRSLKVPLVILSAVPLGLIGVLPGFALLAPFGVYFSATAMIGVIALSGIVVRNSIVLVEFIEERVAHGVALREALIDAGTVRARPILLTAAAGILSSVVIAFDPVWSGLAWALVFGMGASAVLSLFVVPILYAITVDAVKEPIVMSPASILQRPARSPAVPGNGASLRL